MIFTTQQTSANPQELETVQPRGRERTESSRALQRKRMGEKQTQPAGLLSLRLQLPSGSTISAPSPAKECSSRGREKIAGTSAGFAFTSTPGFHKTPRSLPGQLPASLLCSPHDSSWAGAALALGFMFSSLCPRVSNRTSSSMGRWDLRLWSVPSGCASCSPFRSG